EQHREPDSQRGEPPGALFLLPWDRRQLPSRIPRSFLYLGDPIERGKHVWW
ncbi:hypothetical protein NDU88_003970, partial [Pleurodeles waltl]